MKSIFNYIPYEKLKLETALSHNEVLKRLSDNIEPGSANRNWFTGRSSSAKFFEGELTEQSFRVNRIISYRNSFLPVVEGKISSLRFGTTLELSLKMNILVSIIAAIWFTVVLITCIAMLVVQLTTVPTADFPTLIPFVMLGFGALLFLGGFKFESIKARKHLMELLEAREVNE